ncbi:MAG TPA: potassium channel family protein [Longimicrobiales bacterium]|nr:potassium channel family protein [Longimicrobiales bacterium]
MAARRPLPGARHTSVDNHDYLVHGRSHRTLSLDARLAARGLIAVGTVGYMSIERQAFSDARYMTAITITAVGYEEVWPLTPEGRVWRTRGSSLGTR